MNKAWCMCLRKIDQSLEPEDRWSRWYNPKRDMAPSAELFRTLYHAESIRRGVLPVKIPRDHEIV